jgi:hypothetical protein
MMIQSISSVTYHGCLHTEVTVRMFEPLNCFHLIETHLCACMCVCVHARACVHVLTLR